MTRYLITFAAVTLMLLPSVQCSSADVPSTMEIRNFVKQLGSRDHAKDASKRLTEIGSAAIPELEAVLDSKADAELKESVVHIVYEIARPESIRAIKKALADPGWNVREAAVGSLFRMWSVKHVVDRMEAWEPCRLALFDDDSDVRNMAAIGLHTMDHEKCVPLLLDALNREFRQLPEKRGIYQRPDPDGCWGEGNSIAAYTCWLTAPKTNASVIAAYMGKGNRDLDYCLALILLRLDYSPVQTDLLVEGATKCSSPTVRANIIYELWKVDDSRVEGVLKNALEDPTTVVLPFGDGSVHHPIRANADQSLKRLADRKKASVPSAGK